MTSQDQSLRDLSAAIVLLAAILMISRLIIERAPARDWIIPLLLLALGISLLLWDTYARRPNSASSTSVSASDSDHVLRMPTTRVSLSVTKLPAEPLPAPPQPEVPAEPPLAAEAEAAPPQPETPDEPPPNPAIKPARKTSTEQSGDKKSARKQATPNDDFTIIEGIGPKISAALIAAGIRTFADLAATPESRIREILTDAQLRIIGNVAHFIPTWAEQAALAADGRMDDLAAWRAAHKTRQG